MPLGRRTRRHRRVRAKVIAIVAVVAFASAIVVVVSARTAANGLPSYTDGWQKWPRINQQPFRDKGPLSAAHTGLKNVYASKRTRGRTTRTAQ
jgi:hypothetical protein